MKLKEEMREAAAVKMDHGLYGSTAHDIRTGASATLGGEAMAAALSVCDEYEEVEMQEVRGTAPHYLRTRDSAFWEPHLPSFTVYRKKEKPEPDVTELARRAVKAWGRYVSIASRGGEPISDVMAALDAGLKAVDK